MSRLYCESVRGCNFHDAVFKCPNFLQGPGHSYHASAWRQEAISALRDIGVAEIEREENDVVMLDWERSFFCFFFCFFILRAYLYYLFCFFSSAEDFSASQTLTPDRTPVGISGTTISTALGKLHAVVGSRTRILLAPVPGNDDVNFRAILAASLSMK